MLSIAPGSANRTVIGSLHTENLIFIQRSAGNPQDVLTEEIKDLKAEIHRKDQWIQKMHGVSVSLAYPTERVQPSILQ